MAVLQLEDPPQMSLKKRVKMRKIMRLLRLKMRTLALMTARIPLPRIPQKKLVKMLQTAMRLQLKLKMKMQTTWSMKLTILRLQKQKILLIQVKTRLLTML